MSWRKLGKIYCPDGSVGWMATHAANPVAEWLEGDSFRVYFSARDSANRSSIASLTVNLNRPTEILAVSPRPVVTPGATGTFSDSGASMGCLAQNGDKTHLYFLGWNLGTTVPWRNSVGLAIREGDKNNPFSLFSQAPVLDRSHEDPYSVSYPWVIFDNGVWKMWYGSNLAWGTDQKSMAHVLKYAESVDGITWKRTGEVSVGFKDPGEYAMSKPCVIKENGLYRMWYSYRGNKYRIGYAESKDGVRWERLDSRAGIQPSEAGWDSEAISYPNVFDHKDRRYLLYNGNDYGKTGFGLAVWEND